MHHFLPRKLTAIEQISLCSDLPKNIDIFGASDYLLPLPGNYNSTNEDYKAKLSKHFEESKILLKDAIITAENYAKSIKDSINKPNKDKNALNEIHPHIRMEICKYKVLYSKISELRKKTDSTRLKIAEKQILLLKSLYNLAEWLISHPYPVLINIDRAMLKIDAKSFQYDQSMNRELHYFKVAYQEQIMFINHIPYPFRSFTDNRNFLRSLVDSAMASRKANTSYFESPTQEETLFRFFDCGSSPLSKSSLVPIQIEFSPPSVIKWINEATISIAKYDGISINERKEIISIFVTRYIFERIYPKLQPPNRYDPQFYLKRQKILDKKPHEANIPNKYIPQQSVNLPVSKYFESSSIAQAPVQWLKLMQFKVCPLDVAYCIFKTHESLSIMATLQATLNSNGDNSEDFFSKMPGFDDIIDIWICLVCVADVADPRGMNDFIGEWTRLPGFPQRFMACCAYLEAAISQIDEIL